MTTPDAETAKAMVRMLFDSVAPTYDNVGVDFFEVFAAELVRRAAPAPGEHVLDLGTGSGAALRPLAAAVGPTGEVLGIDQAPAMVARTAATIESTGLTQATVRVGDADFPPSREGGWDLVVASLVLFFLPDPVAAARRVGEVLSPQGRFALTSFGTTDPRWLVVDEAFGRWAVGPLRPRNPGAFGSDEGVLGLLREAGFTDIDQASVVHPVKFADAEAYVRFTWSVGQRAWWLQVPEDQRPALKDDLLATLDGIAEPDGSLIEQTTIRYTIARRMDP